MKRFFISCLLAIATLPLLACAWPATHNWYLFSVCDDNEFSERVRSTTEANWKAYLGVTEDRWTYYDADAVIKVAQRKNDALMVSYVKNLEKYLACARAVQNTWDYPTKEELAQNKRTLEAVRLYALSKVKTRLRSQHALLYMRCNMMLDRHQDNIIFWEQTGSQLIETIYKDMMQNIYAGALLKTGRETEASEVFAAQGDWSSLMTQYYLKRSCAAIRKEYEKNPNAAVLPFLLQDFVNNTQEAVDLENDEYCMPGKLFIRDISKKEAQQMIQLCTQAVSEGKSKQPALWQGAKAWIEYLLGSKKQAATDIIAAASMAGSERQKETVRVLMLYITSAQAPASTAFDDYLAGELEWLFSKERSFYYVVYDRLLNQVLVERYNRAGRSDLVAGLLGVEDQDYDYVDTMNVEGLKNYLNYIQTPAQTAIDKWLKPRLQQVDKVSLYDLIGTKYLRLCKWKEAQTWLERVPLSYVEQRRWAVYAANRSFRVEPWVKRQWLKEWMEYSNEPQHFTVHPKIEFAKEMQTMEAALNVLKDKALEQCYYDLAVRYAQVHFTGDCWFLMRDGKSVTDTLRVNETDLAAKTLYLLRKASLSNDFLLKEKALFALSYGELYKQKWFEDVWNNNTGDFDRHANPQAEQYRAFTVLADLEKQNATRTSQYVSRCDEYIQFRKQY
jgi:hypothetical protein